MGRLTNLRPRFGKLAPRVTRRRDAEGHSAVSEPWRAWYHLARWKHPKTGLRIRTLVRDGFCCRWPGCGKFEPNSALLVADHREPHHGDPDLFWDPENVWTLCKPHHDGAKQAEERRGLRG